MINPFKKTGTKTRFFLVYLLLISILLIFNSAPALADGCPLTGMVSYWKLDENSGTTASDSAGSSAGTVSGATWAEGKVSNALSFDGVNDYVNCGSNDNLDIRNELTIEAWIKPDTVNKPYYHSSIVDNGNSYWFYISATGKLSFLRFNANDPETGWGQFSALSTDADILTGTWTHVAATYSTSNGNAVKLYINGELSKSTTFTNGPIDISTSALTIGNRMGLHYFDGKIDEVAVYNRALSSEEISEHYILNNHYDGVKLTFYADLDGDGYGNPLATVQECSAPTGYVSNSGDCGDNNAAIHPGATEVCNGIDDDCDGQVDEGVKLTFYADSDADTYGNSAVTTQACSAPEGYVTDNTDCDDTKSNINPEAKEICNDIDDNCDGLTDKVIEEECALTGMVSYWKLDETSGTTASDSAGSSAGTVSGATWAEGNVSNALSFDGVNDYVNCGSNDNLDIRNELTIEAWIKPDTLSSLNKNSVCTPDSLCQNAIVSKYLGYWLFVSKTGKLSFLRFNANDPETGWGQFSALSTDADILTGTWTHVAATYSTSNGNAVKLYINGELSKSTTFTNGPIDITDYPLTIGEWGGLHYFDGKIDEVAVYNRALSSEEISEHYILNNHYCDAEISVCFDNEPPVWESVPQNQIINEDTSLSYKVEAEDPEGIEIHYSINDSDFKIDNTGLITWTPPKDWYGVKNIIITADDGVDSITAEISITVTSVNDAPVIAHIEDITVIASSLVKIEPTATDVDGDTITFSLTAKPNGMTINPTTGVITWTPNDKQIGSNAVTVVADDGHEGIATQDVAITVKEDLDGDNVPDGTEDSLIYDSDKVDTNIGSLSVIVNGSENTAQTFTGTQTIEIKDSEKPVISFDYNFSAGALDLTKLSIIKQEETATQGSIIIKGITLTDTTKTAYLNSISKSGYVCIKDAEISSITEISENCDGTDETLIQCSETGTAQNGYTCTSLGDYYKIEGLKHSGAKETEFCGDGTCNNGESCSSCATDCGACPTSPGGGSGGSSSGDSGSGVPSTKIAKEIPCEEVSITCEEWNRCINLGRQDRSCEIIKDCSGQIRTNMKWEEQGCETEKPTEKQPTPTTKETQIQEKQKGPKSSMWDGIKNFPTIAGAAVAENIGFGITDKKSLPIIMLLMVVLFVVGLQSGFYRNTYRKIKKKIRKRDDFY